MLLEKFNMKNCKQVSTPIATHFKLSSAQSPTIEKEKKGDGGDSIRQCGREHHELNGVY